MSFRALILALLLSQYAQAASICGPLGARAAALKCEEIADYPDFENACTAFVLENRGPAGSTPQVIYSLSGLNGHCTRGAPVIKFSVTQENPQNNHEGSRNYVPDVSAYMQDFDPGTDVGRWVDFELSPPPAPILSLGLDTEDYRQTNVTGWPLQYGHLFAGANIPTTQAVLDKPIDVEFDLQISRSDVARDPSNAYNGHRVMLGVLLSWAEAAPRRNLSHFLEIDLLQSPGYTASYGEPVQPLCEEQTYDRCFYDKNGRYAEGREVRFQTQSWGSPVPENTAQWVHVSIPITALARSLGWVSPPAFWRAAHLRGLYIGIESEGAARAMIKVRHFYLYAQE